ncbi:MAG: MBL fold metallo-hydrolase [Candidatus Kapaibacteriales bacterium]
MVVGKYNISLINVGDFALDGGAMFGVVPKTLWSRSYEEGDYKNRISLCTRLMIIEGEGKKILVDTGNGNKLDEKSKKIYRIDDGNSSLVSILENAGHTPESFTDILLTHLHFDHVGGATVFDSNGVAVPSFPNIPHHIQKEQLDWARNPSPKDRASFMPENYEPIADAGLFDILEGAGELFPGIHVYPLYGHTKGMQMIRIDGGNETKSLSYFADLCPTSAHLKLPYVMGYDNFPMSTMEEKNTHIVKVAEEGDIAVFEHDAYTSAAILEMTVKGPGIKEKVEL